MTPPAASAKEKKEYSENRSSSRLQYHIHNGTIARENMYWDETWKTLQGQSVTKLKKDGFYDNVDGARIVSHSASTSVKP